MRGVMEKCTYCVQRLTRAKRKAEMILHSAQAQIAHDLDSGFQNQTSYKRAARQIIRKMAPACGQVCATGAITMGDLNDRDPGYQDEPFYQKYRLSRSYQLLTELALRARTTYLGKVRNPNPELIVKKGG